MIYPTQLNDYLSYSVKQNPNKTAIICKNTKISYQEIEFLSNCLAHTLLEFEIERGDRIVICLNNRIETIIIFWAAIKIGAVVSIINPLLKPEKIIYILKDAAARLIFLKFDEKLISTIKENAPCIEKIITIDDAEFLIQPNVISYTNVFTSRQDRVREKVIDLDLAAIIYTSGSTGIPKGVMLTHRNMIAASLSINQYLRLNQDDIIISALPVSFDYGLYQMILTFLNQATLILEEDFSWPIHFLKKISQEQVTVFPGVPTMFSILENHMKKVQFDLTSVRIVTNTGASLLEKHIKIIQKIFPAAQIFSMYGLTECKRCTYLPPEDIDKKPKSLGIAIPNTEMWIIDGNQQKLAPRQIGQLVIRGSTVMKGYWNKPLQTDKVLKDGLLPGEKILYTGDYGYLDEQGYFYFCGRIDEMIKSSGHKVSPKEIEDLIYSFSEIIEAAVIDVPDEHKGNSIVAFIVSENTSETFKSAVFQACRENLEKTHWPKDIIFIDHLQKNINGKIDKLSLKNHFLKQ